MKILLNFVLLKYFGAIVFLASVITFYTDTSYANSSHCVPELSEIQLEGTLITQTYPGPPNYESIEDGDRKMDIWVLKLDKPISCILWSEKDDNGNDIESYGGDLVRVIPFSHTDSELKNYENKSVTLIGRVRAQGQAINLLPMVLDSFTILNNVPVSKIKANETVKEWSDNSGEHKLVIKIDKHTQPSHISVVDKNKKGKHYWNLYDFIPEDCDLDRNLELSKNSLEIKDIFEDGNDVVLFAYFIGCLGGIDNVNAKYFAYYKGEKFSIKGRNTLILGNEVLSADEPPIVSQNLKDNPKLLEYMQNKWPDVSAQVYH